jgi:hypothetical protein
MSAFTKDLKYIVEKTGELASQGADWAVEYFGLSMPYIPNLSDLGVLVTWIFAAYLIGSLWLHIEARVKKAIKERSL